MHCWQTDILGVERAPHQWDCIARHACVCRLAVLAGEMIAGPPEAISGWSGPA